VCAACPTPHLNWSSSSVPSGITSTIHSPPGSRRIQQNYLVSDARLRRKERAPTRRARESSTIWEAIRVQEWTNTAGPAFEREQTPPVQGSRGSQPRVWGIRQQQKQLWYIEPARVSPYSTNSYPWTIPVRVPKVRWAVRPLKWMGVLLVLGNLKLGSII